MSTTAFNKVDACNTDKIFILWAKLYHATFFLYYVTFLYFKKKIMFISYSCIISVGVCATYFRDIQMDMWRESATGIASHVWTLTLTYLAKVEVSMVTPESLKALLFTVFSFSPSHSGLLT